MAIDLRQQAKDEAELYVPDAGTQAAAWASLMEVLEQWKQDHGDRNPRGYSVESAASLLISRPIRFDDAKPWQCTGNDFETATSLAHRLIYGQYGGILALIERLSETTLLAVMLINDEGVSGNWFHTYRRLVHSLIPTARELGKDAAKRDAMDQQLAAFAPVRAKGTITRRETAAEKQRRLVEGIRDLFDTPDKPGWGWTNPQIAEYLGKYLSYAKSTILQTVKREAAMYRRARKAEQARKYLNR